MCVVSESVASESVESESVCWDSEEPAPAQLQLQDASSTTSDRARHQTLRGFGLPSLGTNAGMKHLTQRLAAAGLGTLGRSPSMADSRTHADDLVEQSSSRPATPAIATGQSGFRPAEPRAADADDQDPPGSNRRVQPFDAIDPPVACLPPTPPSQRDSSAQPSKAFFQGTGGGGPPNPRTSAPRPFEDGHDASGGPEDHEVRQITEQWAKLADQRRALRTTFEDIGRKKEVLSGTRKARDDAYMKLRLAVGALLPSYPQLQDLFHEAERAELVYQGAEHNLYDLVGELEREGLDLDFQERKFFTNLARSETSPTSSRPVSRNSLRGIGGDRPENFHPLFENYQEALQDLQLAKEFQANLRMKKRTVELRGVLDREDQDFLFDFPALEERANKKVEFWTQTTESLAEECRKKQVFPNDAVYPHPSTGFDGAGDEINLDEWSESGSDTEDVVTKLAHPRFSYLLTNPAHLLQKPLPQTAKEFLRKAVSLPVHDRVRERYIAAATKEYGIDSLLSSSELLGKHDYINRWMLHKLRQSSMEAEVLLSTFRSRLKIMDWSAWQRDVIFFWSRDDLARQPAPRTETTKWGSTAVPVLGDGDSMRTLPRSSRSGKEDASDTANALEPSGRRSEEYWPGQST